MRGFTLIEILIVIVIIAILAGLTLIGVNAALTTSKVNNTETLIRTIRGACENYKNKWGDYPPTTLAELRQTPPNDVNNGIESLVACLSTQERGGPDYKPPHDDLFCNLDKDKITRNPTNWYFGDTNLRELSDYFGYPLVYMHFKDYAKPTSAMTKVRLAPTGDEQTFKPVRSDATAAFAHPDSFQLISPGKDGILGTKDDIQVK
jgi:prepilin-type N-terminal cleavage/methylation domain-containing protein